MKQRVKALDKIVREAILQRDGRCVLCLSEKFQQWAHIISRRYKMIRWHPLNSVVLCRGCHYRYTVNPDDWDFLRRKKMGKVLDRLWEESRKHFDRSVLEYWEAYWRKPPIPAKGPWK